MAQFRFKQFDVDDGGCAMKVGTDGVLIGAWTSYDGATNIIDVGAGSGLLALMAAQCAADAKITAIEIDTDACACCHDNVSRSPWHDRIDVVCADALDYQPAVAPDLIISNPPFFTNGILSPDSRRACARHAADSMGPINVLDLASRWLSPDGSVAMITPCDIADSVLFEAEMRRLSLWRRCMVSTAHGKQPSRVLWQFARSGKPVEDTTLAVRCADGYSPQYRSLTSGFYLNL